MGKRKIEGNSDYELSNSNNHESSYQSSLFVEKEIKIKRKQNEQTIFEHKRNGPWSRIQEIKFISYVQAHQRIFQDKELRRRRKIFRQMAKCIKSRTSEQCRSHHQKYEIRYVSHQSMIVHIKQKIRKSYDLNQKPSQKQLQMQEVDMGADNLPQIKPEEPLHARNPTRRGVFRENLSHNISSLDEIIVEKGEGYQIIQKTTSAAQIKIVLDLQKFFL